MAALRRAGARKVLQTAIVFRQTRVRCETIRCFSEMVKLQQTVPNMSNNSSPLRNPEVKGPWIDYHVYPDFKQPEERNKYNKGLPYRSVSIFSAETFTGQFGYIFLDYDKASMTPVGFVGLGNMGCHMAKNLLKQGYPLIVYDVYPEAITELQDLGAVVADSAADVAERADRIVTMLPSSPNVIEAYNSSSGILSSVRKGALLIDSSTIDPSVAKEVAAKAENKGAVYMDAPVSGGVNAARDALLTFMVGGKPEEFDAAKELLQCMGKNVINTGPVGTGQAAKICNNMMLGITMIGTSETMNLGIRLGLDPKMLAQILNSSSGRSWSSDTYNPVPGVLEGVPSSNQYKGGFSTALMTKDLGLAQNASTSTKTPTPLGSLAHQIYRLMCSKGYSLKDFSSAYQYLKEEE